MKDTNAKEKALEMANRYTLEVIRHNPVINPNIDNIDKAVKSESLGENHAIYIIKMHKKLHEYFEECYKRN